MNLSSAIDLPSFADVKFELPWLCRGGDTVTTATGDTTSAIADNPLSVSNTPLFVGSLQPPSLNRDDMLYTRAFFNARRGKQQGFRYRLPHDHRSTAIAEDYGNGVTTDTALVQVSTNHFWVYKRYSVGAYSTYRRLRLINRAIVYRNGAVLPTSQWFIKDKGTLVIGGILSGDYTADVDFDLPVRFDTNELQITTENTSDKDKYRVPPLPIREHTGCLGGEYTYVYGYPGQSSTISVTVSYETGQQTLTGIPVSYPITQPVAVFISSGVWTVDFWQSVGGTLNQFTSVPLAFLAGLTADVTFVDTSANPTPVNPSPISVLGLPFSVRGLYTT